MLFTKAATINLVTLEETIVKVILIAAAALGFVGLSCNVASAVPYNHLQSAIQGYVLKAHYGHAARHARRHVRRHYRRWH